MCCQTVGIMVCLAFLIGVPPPIPRTLSLLKSNNIFNFDPREFQLDVELVNGTATFLSWSLNFSIEILAYICDYYDFFFNRPSSTA